MDNSDLDDIFFALSGSTRRQILGHLRPGAATIQELAAPFDVSLNTVSKHIRVLERAGLIRREVRGREHYCHLRPNPLMEAAAFIRRYERFWNDRMDAMEAMIDVSERSSEGEGS